MSTIEQTKAQRVAGTILRWLPAAFLLADSIGKLLVLDPVVKGTVELGYPASAVVGIGLVELVSTLLFLIPRTTLVGAILLTGFLGGATATHVRIGDPFVFPIAVGILIWLGMILRDARLRALVALRT